jgi:hypothetical protein
MKIEKEGRFAEAEMGQSSSLENLEGSMTRSDSLARATNSRRSQTHNFGTEKERKELFTKKKRNKKKKERGNVSHQSGNSKKWKWKRIMDRWYSHS